MTKDEIAYFLLRVKVCFDFLTGETIVNTFS